MTIVAALMGTTLLRANPITVDAARHNVLSFVTKVGMRRAPGVLNPQLAFSIERYNPAVGRKQPVIYAFAFEGESNLVIASADDVAQPVLGYCDKAPDTFDECPDNMKAWLNGLASEIAWARTNGYEVTGAETNNTGKQEVPYLVPTQWDQGNPYYQQCKFNRRYCYTGCVATAMAQVMYYWAVVGHDDVKYRHGCKALDAYTTLTRGYNVAALDSLETFSWELMTTCEPATSESKKAVAQLMRYCGQSVFMDYMVNGSGAYSEDMPRAFSECFGYDEGALFIQRDSMTAEAWDEIIYGEIAAGRPVCMGGGDENSSSGHEFICDGYQASTGKYHFNWGWSGVCDGYYALEALKPGGTGSGGAGKGASYNSERDAIIGIQPKVKTVDDDPSVNPSGNEIVFLASEDLGMQKSFSTQPDSVRKQGVMMKVSPAGSLGSGQNYRIYQGSEITFSTEVGRLAKVVLSCVMEGTSKYGPGCLENPTTGEYIWDGFLGVWTGSAETVTLTARSQVRVTGVAIYLEDENNNDNPDPITIPDTPTVDPIPGDVNNDGVVTIVDVAMIVDCVMGKQPSDFDIEKADVNGDGVVNISDVMSVANIVTGFLVTD